MWMKTITIGAVISDNTSSLQEFGFAMPEWVEFKWFSLF